MTKREMFAAEACTTLSSTSFLWKLVHSPVLLQFVSVLIDGVVIKN